MNEGHAAIYITDNELALSGSRIRRAYYDKYAKELRTIAARHPQSNGKVENLNKWVKELLNRKICDSTKYQEEWSAYLPDIVCAVRMTKQPHSCSRYLHRSKTEACQRGPSSCWVFRNRWTWKWGTSRRRHCLCVRRHDPNVWGTWKTSWCSECRCSAKTGNIPKKVQSKVRFPTKKVCPLSTSRPFCSS